MTISWEAALERLRSIHPRSVMPFVGSGFTLDLGYPSWRGLLEQLAELVGRYASGLAEVMRNRISRGQYAEAADLAYQTEVPPYERVRFFKKLFETMPELGRRHRLLGNLPVGAFLTTNFDQTIERSVAERGRHCTTYSGSDRFARFNSNYPLYLEAFGAGVRQRASVVKIHNDTSDCERIVLSKGSFASLPNTPGFPVFYQNAIRNNHLLFLGFGGNDDNLLDAVLSDIKHYSGYGIADSFLFLPAGANVPSQIEASPISVVYYPPDENHRALTDLLKDLGEKWTACLDRDDEKFLAEKVAAQGTSLPGDQLPLADIPFARTPTIFEVMIPTVRTDLDLRIVEVVSENMVREAIEIAKPHTDPKSIANRLAQKFHLGLEKATLLVARHGNVRAKPVDTEGSPISVLAAGVRQRSLAFDPHFAVASGTLEVVVRSSIELALESYGCALALSLLKGDRPSRADLSHVVRTLVAKQSWTGIGDADRDAILLAIPDLFLRPTPVEAQLINRLAVTASAFGLIQALPTLDMADDLVPSAIYLDTTFVLPLITKAEPRFSGFYSLISIARERGIPVRFLDSFMTEVTSHYRNAITTLREQGIETVEQLANEIGQSLEDHVNVFLLMMARGDYEATSSPIATLQSIWKNGDDSTFRSAIRDIGIEITVPRGTASDDLVRAIIVSKKNWYERSLGARTKLARNEAIQVAELQAVVAEGRAAWFATADAQLRRILRRVDVPAAEFVLPAAGIIGLLDALGTGQELSEAYPRILWTPNVRDEIDQVLGSSIRRMVDQCGEEIRPPIEQARKMAVKEVLRRGAEKQAHDDLEIDTAPDTVAKVIRESVFLGIGRAIEEEKARLQNKR